MPGAAKHESSWDSAFYRFAEGIRSLSRGAINYKILYALVPSRFLRTFRQPHRPALRYGYPSSRVTSR